MKIKINKKYIGDHYPAYIIAEVGSNFDGSLARAKKLARLAKDCGADAFKVQNFLAPKIVSDIGFKNLRVAFQSKWKKPVVEIYRQAEFNRKWLKTLAEYCESIQIDFFSSPYDKEAVDLLETLNVQAHKIGSGEIDNVPFLQYVAKTGKPILLGCGAATIKEIETAVSAIKAAGNKKIVLLQCVTNYPSPIRDSNVNVVVYLAKKFKLPVGYSDHTIGKLGGGDDPLGGITVPLASVALGGSVIEKHFTDDRKRAGPDHPFAMESPDFKRMVDAVRALESAMGDGKKKIMPSEKETVIIQRRGLYAGRELAKGEMLRGSDVEFLRPAAFMRPKDLAVVIGKRIKRALKKGEPLKSEYFE